MQPDSGKATLVKRSPLVFPWTPVTGEGAVQPYPELESHFPDPAYRPFRVSSDLTLSIAPSHRLRPPGPPGISREAINQSHPPYCRFSRKAISPSPHREIRRQAVNLPHSLHLSFSPSNSISHFPRNSCSPVTQP